MDALTFQKSHELFQAILPSPVSLKLDNLLSGLFLNHGFELLKFGKCIIFIFQWVDLSESSEIIYERQYVLKARVGRGIYWPDNITMYNIKDTTSTVK